MHVCSNTYSTPPPGPHFPISNITAFLPVRLSTPLPNDTADLGQVCSCTSRVYPASSIYAELRPSRLPLSPRFAERPLNLGLVLSTPNFSSSPSFSSPRSILLPFLLLLVLSVSVLTPDSALLETAALHNPLWIDFQFIFSCLAPLREKLSLVKGANSLARSPHPISTASRRVQACRAHSPAFPPPIPLDSSTALLHHRAGCPVHRSLSLAEKPFHLLFRITRR